MQIKGRNFLVPIGANIEHEDAVTYQSLDAQAVIDKLESAGNGTNIVILDACRNNPFVRSRGERLRVTPALAWWFAPGVGLPVRWSIDEREDDRLVRRVVFDITALDVLSRPTAPAQASR